MPAEESDRVLVDRVRDADADAWQELIARFEGRLLSFATSRLGNQATGEDVVQETFLGFLTSLPNYDDRRTPLESFLFAICAHKLTDVLRREGRRPTLPLNGGDDDSRGSDPPGPARVASSLLRSREGRTAEAELIAGTLAELIRGWLDDRQTERLKCIELLFVLGSKNKDVANRLGISEQDVANHKQFVVKKLKDAAARSRLGPINLADFGISDDG